jgi:hypothetical protein
MIYCFSEKRRAKVIIFLGEREQFYRKIPLYHARQGELQTKQQRMP